jgi:hypothetical protein
MGSRTQAPWSGDERVRAAIGRSTACDQPFTQTRRAAFSTGWSGASRSCAEQFLRGFRNRRTAVTYGTGLAWYFRWCSQANVDPFEARPSHGRLFLASLSSYCAAIDDELTVADPLRRVRASRAGVRTPTPALTVIEFDRVLAAQT